VAEGVEICYIDKSVMSHVLMYTYVEIEVVSDIGSFSLVSKFNSCNEIICQFIRFRSVRRIKHNSNANLSSFIETEKWIPMKNNLTLSSRQSP
jgi:hypothetical protein